MAVHACLWAVLALVAAVVGAHGTVDGAGALAVGEMHGALIARSAIGADIAVADAGHAHALADFIIGANWALTFVLGVESEAVGAGYTISRGSFTSSTRSIARIAVETSGHFGEHSAWVAATGSVSVV